MNQMILLALAAAAVVATPRAAQAQALGYAIVGPAGVVGPFGGSGLAGHVAAGGELLIGNRVGAGAEHGLIAGVDGGQWATSANLVVHFAPPERSRGTRPFLTGGYTRLSSGDGTFNAWNIGGGVDIWARERVGVRVELRDHIRPDDGGAFHHWGLRAGIVVR